MLAIKKNDLVAIISGKDRGKRGKVLHIYPVERRALVENTNLVKKAKRKTQQDQKGGIISIECPIHLSNLMLVCKQCDRPVRFRTNIMKDGAKIRECKKCGAAI